MRGLPKYQTTTAFVFAMFLLLLTTVANAQLSKTVYKTALLNDTLVAAGNRDFLYNTINITNLTNNKISVIVNVTAPEGWEMVTQSLVTVSLDENGNTSIPIRLVPTKSRTAVWQTVRIEYRLNDGLEKLVDTFRVRVKEFTKFKATLPNGNYVMAGYEKNIRFPVVLRNMGNTPNNYTVKFQNTFLQLDYQQSLLLPPGKDSTFYIPLHITERQWSMLKKEEIKVQVSVENGETMNLAQVVSKIGSVLKEHSSAYLDMPLQLEAGATYQGEDNVQYYGALHGSVDLTPQDKIAIDLRSKTLSKGQAIDNSIVRAEYNGHKWYGTAGNINELTDFYMDGYGAKIGHKWKQRDRLEAYGLLKSRTGDSKLGGVNYEYGGLRENIRIAGGATANFDNERQLNSYLVKQNGEWRFAEQGKLILSGGVGMEQTFQKLAGNAKDKLWGTSAGYNLQWASKWSAVSSSVLYNSNSYPGIFKGQRMQNHDARLIYKKVFTGGFYEYNLRRQNFYQDTTLFSDVFNLETENYGVRTGVGMNGASIVLSAGKQLQVQSDTGNFAKYRFSYLNLNASVLFFKRLSVTLNSYYGEGVIPGQETTTAVTINSNQGNIQYRWIGASFRYDNGPYYYHEYISYIKAPQAYERIVISPFAEISLFKRTLNIRSQLNYNKTKPGDIETSNILANVIYANPKLGFDFNMIGIIPVKQLEMTPYISASLRVRLHAPFVVARKYYALRVVLFKDANNDGTKNNDEEPVAGQMLSLGNNLFITDKDGSILFKNIDKGEYKADFGYSSKIRGWVPSLGPTQFVTVKGNQTLYVPYKISKILQGKLNLTIDSNSNLSFKLNNIKVTAETVENADTIKYATLTDENGEFYFNLPSGNYIITLSPLAFDDNFKPTQFSQPADLVNNNTKTIYFDIKQRKRQINIRKKD